MIILAIETSCDETSIALVKDGSDIIALETASQNNAHKQFGGVVPELASRMHTEIIHTLIHKALKQSKLTFDEINACAVTQGPGLEGALLIGISTAKAISQIKQIPIIATNHLHGHIYANFLVETPPPFPFICLIVSGGHTQLILISDHFQFKLLGETRDDAAGEAFDKIARYLNLGYPGGPIIETLAKKGDPKTYNFPRAMLKQGYEFSFSGLKTAVIQTVKQLDDPSQHKEDICASFQEAVIDILAKKSIKACLSHNIKHLAISGGVAANNTLKSRLISDCQKNNMSFYCPDNHLCTDNAAMIGAVAYYQYQYKGASNPLFRVNSGLQLCN